MLASLRRRLARPAAPAYEFSTDWCSGNVYLFERHLAHLRGQPCRLLEIGCFEGRSTVWLLDHVATDPAARIDCVERSVRTTFRGNIGKNARGGQVVVHEGKSRDVLPTLPRGAFDFIYVDGSHRKVDVLEDAVLAFRLAKPGGVVAFDDYTEDGPEWNATDFAKPAIDAFLAIYADLIEVRDHCHQVWIRKLSDEADVRHEGG